MALSRNDKEWIAATFKSSILEAVAPIQEEQNKHKQTLYGVNMDDGLVGTVESMKHDHDKSKAQMWKFVGIASGTWVGILAIITLASKFIFHLW